MIQSSLSRLALLAAIGPRFARIMPAATGTALRTHQYFHISALDSKSERKFEPQFTWCKTVSLHPGGESNVESVAGHENDHPIRRIQDQVFDLTQSVDWMEYLERTENRQGCEGGAGAYDTLRCDVILSPLAGSSSRLRVWGENYHLSRLKNSYMSLLGARDKHLNENSNPALSPDISQHVVDEALEHSRALLLRLLSEAESSVKKLQPDLFRSKKDTIIRLFRVTLLWSPPISDKKNDKILVRGHACTNCSSVGIHGSPASIVVSVAVHTSSGDSETATIDNKLPTRFANPQSKIASWCRLRKKMEKPTYKPPGVSEVLMVRPRRDEEGESRLEVLEGLSSNFFVIYKDGTLRTATEGVLNGYVRHLVLESAKKCGLKIDPRPIFLHEASEWEEAFITSSSRLIYPISKILLPEDRSSVSHEGSSFVEHWQDVFLNGDASAKKGKPKWQQLLDNILETGGYEAI